MAKKKTDTQQPESKPAAKAPKKETVDKALFELTVASYLAEIKRLKILSIGAVCAAFFFGTFVQGNIDRCFSRHQNDRQEQREDKKTPAPVGPSITRWVKAERPMDLVSDFSSVRFEIEGTARRLRVGTLSGYNDSLADLIARVQPVVSSPDKWRTWLNRLGVQIQGGDSEALAKQYDDAAKGLDTPEAKAVAKEAKVEKDTNQVDAQNSASDNAVVPQGRNESKDKPSGNGATPGAAGTAKKATGTGAGAKQSTATRAPSTTAYPSYYGGCATGMCGGSW